MIIFSCMGNKSDIQEQVSVGVGTLAGSTIMLLTVAWGFSMFVARCDVENGKAVDRTLSYGRSLTKTGVTVDRDCAVNSIWMLVTSLTYFVVQGKSPSSRPRPLRLGFRGGL